LSVSPGCGLRSSAAVFIMVSVVIFYADVFGTLRSPVECDAPLIVDADGVAVLAITQQLVESVGRRKAEGFERGGGGKFAKLP